MISQTDKRIVVSPRVQILELRNDEAYFETMGSWYLNKAIEQSEDMIYIDCFDEHYKLLKVSIL